jgi:hypothetical protein
LTRAGGEAIHPQYSTVVICQGRVSRLPLGHAESSDKDKGGLIELPIVAPAPVLSEHAAAFRDLFENLCQMPPGTARQVDAENCEMSINMSGYMKSFTKKIFERLVQDPYL